MFWCPNLFVPYDKHIILTVFFFKPTLPTAFSIQHLRCWNILEKNHKSAHIGISSYAWFLISVRPLMLPCGPSISVLFTLYSSYSYLCWGGGLSQNNTFRGDNEWWLTWAERRWPFSGASLRKAPPLPCWDRHNKHGFLQTQTQGKKWFLQSALEERQDPERRQRRKGLIRGERTSEFPSEVASDWIGRWSIG